MKTYLDYVALLWDSDKPGLKDRAADLMLKAAMRRRLTGIPRYTFDPLKAASQHAWESEREFENTLRDFNIER